jgi:hypothetical protein
MCMRILARLLPFASLFLLAQPAAAQRFDAPPPLPEGAMPNQPVPAHESDGSFVTPNHHLSADATSWHLRAALNVAALGCRDALEHETVAAYNTLLVRHGGPLASADLAVKAEYRARFGASGEDEHDHEMTRVYNFFAQPPAQRRFCDAARQVLQEAIATDPAQFAAFAAAALPRLEAPFTDFYRDVEAYRVAYAAWSTGGVMVASAPVPAPAADATANAPVTMAAAVIPVPRALIP